MPLCPVCGLHSESGLCWIHLAGNGQQGEGWAQANRIWCDYFHRGVTPPRPVEASPDDFFEAWGRGPFSE